MSKFYDLDFIVGKKDNADITKEEIEKFNDLLIEMAESLDFEICGMIKPSKDN